MDAHKSSGKHAMLSGVKSRPTHGMDKGMAPPWPGQPKVEDGQNINIPRDSEGYSITVQNVRGNITAGGDANYVGPFRNVVDKGNGAALSGKRGYADGTGTGGRGIGRDSGLGESANKGEEAEENDDLD